MSDAISCGGNFCTHCAIVRFLWPLKGQMLLFPLRTLTKTAVPLRKVDVWIYCLRRSIAHCLQFYAAEMFPVASVLSDNEV